MSKMKSLFGLLKLFLLGSEERKEAFDVSIRSRFRQLLGDSRSFERGIASGAAKPDRIILFSHFDSRSILDPYVLYYLDFLSKDIDAYFFIISTSTEIKNQNEVLNHPRCLGLLTRANHGLDFNSWKAGYKILQKQGIDFSSLRSLTFANDSCFGPLFSLREYFESVERDLSPEMGGVTESLSFSKHIQSYFFVLNNATLRTDFLSQYFQGVRPITSKTTLIQRYEVGMGALATGLNIRLNPFLSTEKIGSALSWDPKHPYFSLVGTNSTVLHWDVLLKNKLSPFLKKSVFLEQPSDLPPPKFEGWRDAIQCFSRYPVSLIDDCANYFGVRKAFSASRKDS